MAKVLWSTEDEEQFNISHPGCMFGIFHQYWHSNVKKILPSRKRHDSLVKHAKRNKRFKKISDDQDPFEVLKLLDATTSHILVDQNNKKTNSTQKKSLKARIKALVSEENDAEDFVSSPKLQRTYSIHHLETNEWVHPIIFFPENDTRSPESSTTQSDVMDPKINDSRDILDLFEVDKKIFENILQDCSQSSDTKAKLTKSGSFPLKLKDKINEFYTISKAEKRLDSGKNTNYNHNDNNVRRLRRISSLNESTDRYVGKEATLRRSMSLKLTNETENLLHDQEPSFFRDTYLRRSYSQKERNPVSLLLSTNKCEELNNTQDCESLNEVIDKSRRFSENEHSPKAKFPAFGEVTYELISDDGNHQILLDEKVQPEVQISEGFQGNFEKEIKIASSKKHMKSSMRYYYYYQDDDFIYVKQILERSGFIKNGFQQTWFSSNQPLDPFTFQEIESQYFYDPERFAKEVNELSHRLLIFDLVDDILLTMYERLLTYYPKPLSSSCHIHPAPTGLRVLDEVWKRVTRLVNLKPDMFEPLGYIVSRDLGNDDGWMNLQLDSECVALDLEDLILDEVLEEVLFE